LPFFAAGLSLILHPSNPNVPTVHSNYRYFEITESTSEDSKIVAWWFGAITDLTPYYLFDKDVSHFHQTLKEVCEKYGEGLYEVFKKDCDEYLFIRHRDEYRGVGGLRINDLSNEPHPLLPDSQFQLRPRNMTEIFSLIKSVGNSFLPSYLPIIQKRKDLPFDSQMRRWQLLRRGRYVEFNLIYERGTKFGLATPGIQVENVLMGLPAVSRWEYMSDLGLDGEVTLEGRLMVVLKQPKSWVS
jgi:coproporphyrinogen III oxidase